jgi:hypothetical protein
LTREDVEVQALILDDGCQAAIERARLEEPHWFVKTGDHDKDHYQRTRCHNELKTATDYASDLSKRSYFYPKNKKDNPQQSPESSPYAPAEPPVRANFSYKTFKVAPLCYLVIFEDYMFLESYHNAGRGGESPVLKIARQSGEGASTTSLYKIYEDHYKVMEGLSVDKEAAQPHAS